MYRGYSLEQFCNQVCSNALDPAKGRQMPIHYGSDELNYQTISSPLATQLPHAAGAAYANKLEGKDKVSICFFGDGAASEGDFHAALNFAATTKSPVIFFCRNNGYAISTPIEEQMAGDGIVARGPAYGIPATRVDGNDIWAVYAAVEAARKMAVEESTPVLIEAITYRSAPTAPRSQLPGGCSRPRSRLHRSPAARPTVMQERSGAAAGADFCCVHMAVRMGHHSTSDDSTRYREQQEMDVWKESDNPIQRMRLYLTSLGCYSKEREDEYRKEVRKEVLVALKKAEKGPMLDVEHMFDDVYDEIPKHLAEQAEEVQRHVKKYPEFYEGSGH